MTPTPERRDESAARQLAEKICRYFCAKDYDAKNISDIDSLLTEALAEAVSEKQIELGKTLENLHGWKQQCIRLIDKKAEAKAAAYEECAKIAENGPLAYSMNHIECADDTGKNIATLIRLRASELK